MYIFSKGNDLDQESRKIPSINVGDTLTLKKPHPCGVDRFRVMRTGSDVRVVCAGCGRDLTMPREKLERAIKKIERAKSVPDKT